MRAAFLSLRRLRASTWARHAAAMLALNLVSKGIAVFGNGYAARCLGPINLGLSAVILNFSQQALLLCNGGFDNVAVREIARAPGDAAAITRVVTGSRLMIGGVLALIWIALSFVMEPELPRSVKLLGAPLLLFGTVGMAFAFQGMERLPIQTAIGTGVSLLTAAGYFCFFHPAMRVGSDLVVMTVTGAIGVIASALCFQKLTGRFPIGRFDGALARRFFAMSWRYWLTAAAIFVYFSLQIPIIAHFLGAAEAGIYRSALLLTAGIDLVYGSVNNLLLPRLVQWHRRGGSTLRRKKEEAMFVYVFMACVFSLFLELVAPFLYGFLFGAQFHGGLPIFRILILARAIAFLGQIYLYELIVLNWDRTILAITLTAAALSLVLNWTAIPLFGLGGAAMVALGIEVLVAGLACAAVQNSAMP